MASCLGFLSFYFCNHPWDSALWFLFPVLFPFSAAQVSFPIHMPIKKHETTADTFGYVDGFKNLEVTNDHGG
jgi:hypothetical protein